MPEENTESQNALKLRVEQHDRDASMMRYVYPVVSRRAGGVSIGINLNVNNACNWACIYCQVADLRRGGPPEVDLPLLSLEFERLLDDVLTGSFLECRVDESMRRLADVAFSGNGEPTSSDQFPDAVARVLAALDRRGLAGRLPVRVITNGSLLHRSSVQDALAQIGRFGGEIWFKVDRASEAGWLLVNRTAINLQQVERNLAYAAKVAPVWIQTCWFGVDGLPPDGDEADTYVAFVTRHKALIRGVHLYGIARPSMQAGADRLTRLPIGQLNALADRLKKNGVIATVSE